MLIKLLIVALFRLITKILSLTPAFPQLETFQNLDTSEFTNTLTTVSNVLGYFFPCGVIVSLIAVELLINNYRLLTSVWYRIKHLIPFV